jgi:pullulanase
VWAPTASAVDVLTYADAAASTGNAVPMTKDVNGTWIATIDGDQDGLVYNYQVHFGDTTNEAVDPYARAVTVNGDRGVVVDLDSTDPAGFSATSKPSFGKATDALIYELHIRDFSISSNSGMTNKGKYLAFTETNTVQPGTTNKTGINYLKSLGITHVELLPFFDYASVDETNLSTPQFNWGYDPKNYNAPEGSYSSDPTNPKARITELKSAIQSLHTNGLRVIMDVVYNHMFSATDSSFEKIVPGYFFRKNADGSFANGTGCGNEVASERSMARKFIVDSTKYWANEYGVDGYRFDLMGILDVQTMNQVRAELTKINPTILVIGEGWDMGNALAADKKANQKNAASMPNIAHFNDGIRDGLKGSVFDQYGAGWANGNADGFANTKAGISGGTQFATSPVQAVNYVEAHDNNTLWDKLSFTNGSTSTANKIKMDRLASSVAILAQGIPFVHAGQEFLRTKNGNENSYNAPDSVNQLDWSRTGTYKSTVDYFKGLFALRKAHPAFRMTTAAQVRTNQRFISTGKSTVIAYTLNNKANGDTWKTIAVIHNSTSGNQTVNLPSAGPWYVVANGDKAGTATLSTVKANKVTVTGYSTFVLYSK